MTTKATQTSVQLTTLMDTNNMWQKGCVLKLEKVLILSWGFWSIARMPVVLLERFVLYFLSISLGWIFPDLKRGCGVPNGSFQKRSTLPPMEGISRGEKNMFLIIVMYGTVLGLEKNTCGSFFRTDLVPLCWVVAGRSYL